MVKLIHFPIPNSSKINWSKKDGNEAIDHLLPNSPTEESELWLRQ